VFAARKQGKRLAEKMNTALNRPMAAAGCILTPAKAAGVLLASKHWQRSAVCALNETAGLALLFER